MKSAECLGPKDLYEIYIQSSDGKAWNGAPCPTWDQLNDAVRRHWTVVSQAAHLAAEGSLVLRKPLVGLEDADQPWAAPAVELLREALGLGYGELVRLARVGSDEETIQIIRRYGRHNLDVHIGPVSFMVALFVIAGEVRS